MKLRLIRCITAAVLISVLLALAACSPKDVKDGKSSSKSGSLSESSEVLGDESDTTISGESEISAENGATSGAGKIPSKSPNAGASSKKSSGGTSSKGGTTNKVEKIAFDAGVWNAPAKIENASELDYQGVKGIYFDSVKYNGSSTKVFAYIGYPDGASSSKKVPAVVLVHGGGGTAYADWVLQWTKRGYAAIAIDTEGREPAAPNSRLTKSHKNAGPARTGDFNDSFLALEKQWMYQACSAVIKANSLLRADSKIDSSKIGITGISWGGIITSIVMSQDDRFAFAVPVYGTGNMPDTTGHFSDVFKENKKAQALWEPSNWFSLVNMPVLFINGAADVHFSIISTARSQSAVKNANMTVLPNLPHGHEYAWENALEAYAFADSVVRSGNGFIKVTRQPTASDASVNFSLPKGVTAKNAEIVYSKIPYAIDYSQNQCLAVWMTTSAAISGTGVKATIPAGTRSYYINITDNRGLTVSSHMVSVSGGSTGESAKVIFEQKFSNQSEFSASVTSGANYENNPLKWGNVPNSVKTSYATGGNDGGCMLVSDRNDWGDSARIRINKGTLQAGKTYRLSVDFKNGDSSKGLYLTPAVTLFGAGANNSYPSNTFFMPAGCDLGRDSAPNKNKWVTYKTTFSISQSGNKLTLSGFGGTSTVEGADLGFAAMNLMFVTPGGNTSLNTCPFYIDNFKIEEIS